MALPVMGVVYSQDKPQILLGNQILGEGESLGDITVKKINPDMTVVLTQNGQDFVRSVNPESNQVAGTFPEGAGIQYSQTMTPEQDISAQEAYRTQRGLPVAGLGQGQFPTLRETPILDEKGQTTKLMQDAGKAMHDYIKKNYADDMQLAETADDPHLRTMAATKHLMSGDKIERWSDELAYGLNQINEYTKYDEEQKQEAYKQYREKMKAKAPFSEALAGMPEQPLSPYDKAKNILEEKEEVEFGDLHDEWSRMDTELMGRTATFGPEETPQQKAKRESDREAAYLQFQEADRILKSKYSEQRRKLDRIKSARLSPVDEQNAYNNVAAAYMPNISETQGEGAYGKPPWYMSPEFSGTEQGRIAGGLEPRGRIIPASTIESMDAIKTIQQLANDIDRLYTNKPEGAEWVGLAQGPYRGLVRRTKGIGVNEEEFRRNANMVGQLLGYALSGKTLNPVEIEMLKNASPQLNLPPQTFKSNLIAFKKLLNQMLIQRQKGLAGAGYNMGESQNAQPTGLTPEEQDELAELRREAQR